MEFEINNVRKIDEEDGSEVRATCNEGTVYRIDISPELKENEFLLKSEESYIWTDNEDNTISVFFDDKIGDADMNDTKLVYDVVEDMIDDAELVLEVEEECWKYLRDDLKEDIKEANDLSQYASVEFTLYNIVNEKYWKSYELGLVDGNIEAFQSSRLVEAYPNDEESQVLNGIFYFDLEWLKEEKPFFTEVDMDGGDYTEKVKVTIDGILSGA